MTAALTEMWRSQRCAVGVLYYEYLGSYLARRDGPYHFGAFADVTTLEVQPEFEKYMTEAFKPLGVYLAFWGDGEPGTVARQGQWFPIRGGQEHSFDIRMVNDDQEPVTGNLVLSVENLEGKVLTRAEKRFRVDGVGRNACELSVVIPEQDGRYVLKAVASPDGTRHESPTVSVRKISVEKQF